MKIRSLDLHSVHAQVACLRPPAAEQRAVAEAVSRILAEVQARGDEALAALTAQYDWPEATKEAMRVLEEEVSLAYGSADPEFLAALCVARDNCLFFHRHELVPDWEDVGPQGQRLGMRFLPVERAGLYVPGGRASYASTVIMNAAPALAAGVREIVLSTPPGRDGRVDSYVLAAARLVGIERIFRVGGAQAIGAMAFGTETVPKVDIICGPGNVFVMEAKRQVFGLVGIDSLAGPSEVLIVADRSARPDWVAVDLLAQEEHGSGASAVLLAETEEFCVQVSKTLEQLARAGREEALSVVEAGNVLPREAQIPGENVCAFFPTNDEDFLALAEALVNEYAPEHLELHLEEPREFLPRVRSAGAVFLGGLTPTAFGDYVVGSNHVLPTGGSARFSSTLSVHTFMRRLAVVETPAEAVRSLTALLARVAESEGFIFHRKSAELRASSLEGSAESGKTA